MPIASPHVTTRSSGRTQSDEEEKEDSQRGSVVSDFFSAIKQVMSLERVPTRERDESEDESDHPHDWVCSDIASEDDESYCSEASGKIEESIAPETYTTPPEPANKRRHKYDSESVKDASIAASTRTPRIENRGKPPRPDVFDTKIAAEAHAIISNIVQIQNSTPETSFQDTAPLTPTRTPTRSIEQALFVPIVIPDLPVKVSVTKTLKPRAQRQSPPKNKSSDKNEELMMDKEDTIQANQRSEHAFDPTRTTVSSQPTTRGPDSAGMNMVDAFLDFMNTSPDEDLPYYSSDSENRVKPARREKASTSNELKRRIRTLDAKENLDGHRRRSRSPIAPGIIIETKNHPDLEPLDNLDPADADSDADGSKSEHGGKNDDAGSSMDKLFSLVCDPSEICFKNVSSPAQDATVLSVDSFNELEKIMTGMSSPTQEATVNTVESFTGSERSPDTWPSQKVEPLTRNRALEATNENGKEHAETSTENDGTEAMLLDITFFEALWKEAVAALPIGEQIYRCGRIADVADSDEKKQQEVATPNDSYKAQVDAALMTLQFFQSKFPTLYTNFITRAHSQQDATQISSVAENQARSDVIRTEGLSMEKGHSFDVQGFLGRTVAHVKTSANRQDAISEKTSIKEMGAERSIEVEEPDSEQTHDVVITVCSSHESDEMADNNDVGSRLVSVQGTEDLTNGNLELTSEPFTRKNLPASAFSMHASSFDNSYGEYKLREDDLVDGENTVNSMNPLSKGKDTKDTAMGLSSSLHSNEELPIHLAKLKDDATDVGTIGFEKSLIEHMRLQDVNTSVLTDPAISSYESPASSPAKSECSSLTDQSSFSEEAIDFDKPLNSSNQSDKHSEAHIVLPEQLDKAKSRGVEVILDHSSAPPVEQSAAAETGLTNLVSLSRRSRSLFNGPTHNNVELENNPRRVSSFSMQSLFSKDQPMSYVNPSQASAEVDTLRRDTPEQPTSRSKMNSSAQASPVQGYVRDRNGHETLNTKKSISPPRHLTSHVNSPHSPTSNSERKFQRGHSFSIKSFFSKHRHTSAASQNPVNAREVHPLDHRGTQFQLSNAVAQSLNTSPTGEKHNIHQQLETPTRCNSVRHDMVHSPDASNLLAVDSPNGGFSVGIVDNVPIVCEPVHSGLSEGVVQGGRNIRKEAQTHSNACWEETFKSDTHFNQWKHKQPREVRILERIRMGMSRIRRGRTQEPCDFQDKLLEDELIPKEANISFVSLSTPQWEEFPELEFELSSRSTASQSSPSLRTPKKEANAVADSPTSVLPPPTSKSLYTPSDFDFDLFDKAVYSTSHL